MGGQKSLFRELRILFTSLSEKERSELENLCITGGGHVVTAITPNDPPHVVVTRRVGSPKYCNVLRKHPMTPVVSPEWIKNSLEQKKRLPYSQYAVGPCYGLKICLSGFSPEEKSKLAELVQKNGGTHSPSLTKHCTHLISTSKTSEKYVFAQKQGIACANAEWLVESIKGGWCRDTTPYPVKDSLPGDKSSLERKNIGKGSRDPAPESGDDPVSVHTSRDAVDASKGRQVKENRTLELQDEDTGDDSEEHANTFLDHCVIWTVGCSLDETVLILKLCRKSGAKRITFGHPNLITHILRGSSLNALESREVSTYLQDKKMSAPPVVNIEWLQRSVARREAMPIDERFASTISKVSDGIKLGTLDNGRAVQSLTNEYSNVSESVGKKYDGFFSGYYFTLCAIRGTSEECVAEALIRRHGGKIFNASSPPCGSRFLAICPASLKPIEINRLRSQNNNFATVLETNRFTVYWLRCCAEANQILSPRKGAPCFRPLPFDLPMDGAKGLSIAISGYDKSIRSAIKHTVETIGGRVSLDCMSAKDTHLLVPYAHGEKYKHSERLGVKAVTTDWLVESVASGRILPEAPYRPMAKEGCQAEKLAEGPGIGKVDATQHPWTDGSSKVSKDGNCDDEAPESGKIFVKGCQRSLTSKERKRKFTMPSLEVISTNPSKSHEKRHNIENRVTQSNRKRDEATKSQNHSSKDSKDDDLAHAQHQVHSLLSKLNQTPDDNLYSPLFPDVQEDKLQHEGRLAKQHRRPALKPSDRRQGLRSSLQSLTVIGNTDGDEFEISQRVGYNDA